MRHLHAACCLVGCLYASAASCIGPCMHGWGLADSAKRAEQAVKQLTEAVASLPEDACSDLLILPLYAAMPLELQV